MANISIAGGGRQRYFRYEDRGRGYSELFEADPRYNIVGTTPVTDIGTVNAALGSEGGREYLAQLGKPASLTQFQQASDSPDRQAELYKNSYAAVSAPALGAGSADFTLPKSISSESLASQPGITPTQPTYSPNPDISKLNAKPDEDLFKLSAPEQQAQNIIGDVQTLNEKLVGKTAFTQEQEGIARPELGNQSVIDLLKTQKDLSAQLKQLQAEAASIPIQLEQDAQRRGISTAILGRQQQELLRQNAVKALTTSSLLEASRGNLSFAYDLVDRAVKAKFGPLEEERAAKLSNLELILKSPDYSMADKKRAATLQLQIKQEKDKQKEAEREQKLIWDTATSALEAAQKNGIAVSASQLSQIQNAKTPEEALTKANALGVFVQPPNTQVVQLSDGSDVLIDQQTGKVIRTIGGGGGGGGTPTEPGASDISNRLLQTRGKDGFVNPQVYQQEKLRVKMGPDEFDKRFGYLLSPQEQVNLGVRKIEGVKPQLPGQTKSQNTFFTWLQKIF